MKDSKRSQETDQILNKKKEGDYRDFKKDFHANKADLIHDVICLANSTSKKNRRYIIFGVTNDFQLDGIKKTKELSYYINLLSQAHFANNCFPEIQFDIISKENKDIAILTIHNILEKKPYFLTKKYHDGDKYVNAYVIYTRRGDTNIPRDQGATKEELNLIWEQKFHLDHTPLQQLYKLMKNPNQRVEYKYGKYFYHKKHPEYTIQLGPCRDLPDGYDYFSYLFLGEKTRIGEVEFKYHNTILAHCNYLSCDDTQEILPEPANFYGHSSFDRTVYNNKRGTESTPYQYILLNSIEGKFYRFISSKKTDIYKTNRGYLLIPFLIFKDKREHELFREHISQNKNVLSEEENDWRIASREQEYERKGRNSSYDLQFIGKLTKVHYKRRQ